MKTQNNELLFCKKLYVGFIMAIAIGTQAQTFTTLHSFNGSDGDSPYGDLVLSGNTLFGTTAYGGGAGKGNIFSINADGTGFTNLHTFSGSDGNYPSAGLIFYSNTLYGTVSSGGSFNRGAVFSMNTDGTGYTNLYNFSPDTFTFAYNYYAYTNSNGAYPRCVLKLSGNTLYGTTPQ